ncbi:hypothetical protein HY389_00655 [Candidatus Daviesbacteria bacterium]|nr:hypothetical protein [Candidatus Daviesbacteria bacterium]
MSVEHREGYQELGLNVSDGVLEAGRLEEVNRLVQPYGLTAHLLDDMEIEVADGRDGYQPFPPAISLRGHIPGDDVRNSLEEAISNSFPGKKIIYESPLGPIAPDPKI